MTDISSQFFVASISHDIKNILNGIVGYSQLLSQTKLNTTQKTYTNSISTCCIQLVELVNDVLDFSKLTSGKATINNECFSIQEIIEEINAVISQRIKQKKQKLKYVISKDIPEYIISDKQKVIQILVNLISNANKFTPIKGRIIVNISLLTKTPANPTLEFSVEDNGIGITQKDQEKIFDAFFQVQESVTKNGSGLGLAICRKLVELLKGEIRCESEKDQGSVFTFTVQYDSYEKFEKHVQNNSISLDGKHVLIVDDNMDNRLIIGEMLFEYKILPIICSSGKETLRMITGKRYPFSCALIDICMPEISGIELAKQIKELDQEIPLIALSSLDEPFDVSHFEHVLLKPINKVKLIDTLSKVINKTDITLHQLNPVNQIVPVTITPQPVKILVAEDISYNLDMLVKMLNSMKYKDVTPVLNGEEAIKKIDQEKYDIVILDIKMPNVDGIQVAEYIMKKKEVKDKPEIVIITASVLEKDKETCKELGVKFFLSKPFNMGQLRSIMNKLVYGGSPPSALRTRETALIAK